MQKYVVIVAGGSGTRMKREIPKQFIPVAGKPILMHTLQAFHNFSAEISIILVLPESQILGWKSLCAQYKFDIPHKTTVGGETRFHSVKNGLSNISGGGLVAIHDGVRPLVSDQIILNSFAIAEQKGNAIAAIPLKDSIRWSNGIDNKVVNRNDYQLIQTPQTFQIALIKKAFDTAYDSGFTDDASVLEATGATINLIEGDYSNIKITTPEDLIVAESLLNAER
ncbi:MAG: 2-C-methyl-D-erythritol 4-phosphate cytidylyltransferase [Roseivirga sp.]|nr:2-C-methyl-D-erythritol 4-phosphate cytidylyltransferase [Roseivirga sp.]